MPRTRSHATVSVAMPATASGNTSALGSANQSHAGTSAASQPPPGSTQNGDVRQIVGKQSNVREPLRCQALEQSVSPFSGTGSGCPEAWIASYKRYALLKGWDTDTQALCFPLFLNSSALMWYESALEDNIKGDFNEVSSRFIAEFTLTRSQMLAELNNLLGRRQAQGEPIEAYLLDIAHRCKKLKRTKEQQFEYAINGLLPNIKGQVLLQQAATVEDIKRIGILCELVQPKEEDTLVASLREQIRLQQETINTLSYEQRDTVNKLTHERKPRPAPYTKRWTNQTNLNQTEEQTGGADATKCDRCGLVSCRGKTLQSGNCPAFGKFCHKCNKPNHFARVCRSRSTQKPDNSNVTSSAESNASSQE